MDILKKLEWRYAVKKFDADKIIPQEKIKRLQQAFNLTATSYGLQPVKMIVLKNKELQKQLVAHSYGQQQVEQASHILILCRETVVNQEYIEEYFDRTQKIRGTSAAILNPFKEQMVHSFKGKTEAEIAEWAINQAYLILGNLLTVCAVEEIDACPMEGFIPAEYDKLLGVDKKNLASVLVLPIGFRAADDMFSDFKKVRKDAAESIIEIT